MSGEPFTEHLRPVFEAELERGNRMVTTTTGPGEEGSSVLLAYELDGAAIREQFDLGPGHSVIRNDRGGWVVRCEHTNTALLGLSARRSWLARRALRRWWSRWNAGPHERISL